MCAKWVVVISLRLIKTCIILIKTSIIFSSIELQRLNVAYALLLRLLYYNLLRFHLLNDKYVSQR